MISRAEERAKSTKFFEKTVKIWLRTLGIYSSTGWMQVFESVHRVLYQISLICIVAGLFASLPRMPTYRLKTEISLYPVAALVNILTTFRVWYDQQRLMRFFDDLLRSSRSPFGQKWFISVTQRFRRLCAIIVPISVLYCVNEALVSFSKSFNQRNFNEQYSFTLPFFLTCEHDGITSAQDVEGLCWDAKNYSQYFVKNSFLSVIHLILIVPFFIYLTFGIFVIMYVRTSVDVIREELHLVMERVNRGERNEWRTEGVKAHSSIISTINHYLELNRIVINVIPILNLLTEYYLLVFGFLSLFVLAPVVKQPELLTDFVYASRSMTTLVAFFVGLSVFCYGGQIIKEMNGTIAETVYDLSWYAESINTRKLLYRFLLLLQKPCRVIAFYKISADLGTTLLTLYRLYTLLNTVLSIIRMNE